MWRSPRTAPLAYVTNGANSVSAVDTATDTVTATAAVGSNPRGVAIASVTSPPSADLAGAVTDSADPVALGDNYTYTTTVTNNGPAAATGVSTTVTLSGAARTIVSATSS